jgi:diguanylate cyclase (GGDEF)-like protein
MKILLVDDSRAIAMVMTARLESFGHEVRHVLSGELAIGLFQSERFDLILMDVEMPGMNGFEATTRIRAIEGGEPWAWTPIIFVTATDTDANLITAIEAGGDDFISKSVTEAVLQAKMKAMARIAALRSRLAQANHKLQEQANRDGLTGLLNRRAMDMKVDLLWDVAVREGKPFSLLMIDVDHFKLYNDHYGHQSGDDCLRAVAASLERVAQQLNDDRTAPGTFAARYGGEEFSIVVPDVPLGVHAAIALAVVDAVGAIGLPHAWNDQWGKITVSVGAACMERARGEVKQVFRQADELLYQAKASGRNRFMSN